MLQWILETDRSWPDGGVHKRSLTFIWLFFIATLFLNSDTHAYFKLTSEKRFWFLKKIHVGGSRYFENLTSPRKDDAGHLVPLTIRSVTSDNNLSMAFISDSLNKHNTDNSRLQAVDCIPFWRIFSGQCELINIAKCTSIGFFQCQILTAYDSDSINLSCYIDYQV